jgi:uncharacterized protein (DUF924 family)
MPALPQDVVGYWRNAGPRRWFRKDAAFDDALRLRFEPVHLAAARGQYDDWAQEAEPALALILLLDQIPRNIFRDSAHAFATDGKARRIARLALRRGFDLQVEAELRHFVYMPLEHSEDPVDQADCVRLIQALCAETRDTELLRFAELHRDIIDRFGRFPHRNAALGRESTTAELAYLADGGFAG